MKNESAWFDAVQQPLPLSQACHVDDLEIAGVERWADSAVELRCRFRVAPLEQWNVRREFRRRLKIAFDERGIEIFFPHVTVYAGVAKSGASPEFRVDARQDSQGDARSKRE